MNKSSKKSFYIILGTALVIMLAIIIPLILTGEKVESNRAKYFPTYTDIKVNSRTFTDEEKYEDLRKKLSEDFLFERLITVGDYDSSYMTKKDLDNLIENYMINFELSNTRYLTKFSKEKQYICMTESNLKESYVELYNTDISKYLDDMMYRFKYMFRKQNYCMYYTKALDFTMYGRMFYINKMDCDKENEIITADIYLYTYPITTEAETSAQATARTAMNNKEFDRAKKLIVEDSDGKYERKTIRFKINNNGKFFKYQIISIKTTDK